jgi:hypothetical protein
MTRERCLQSAKKALDRGSPSQRGGASRAYPGILKTFDSAEFCC